MDLNKNLFFLFVYWLIFMSSFYGAYQVRMYNKDGVQKTFMFLGREFNTAYDATTLNITFYSLSIVTLLASMIMIYVIVTYNYKVVEDEDNIHKTIEEAWKEDPNKP
jgi:hypothetical protein